MAVRKLVVMLSLALFVLAATVIVLALAVSGDMGHGGALAKEAHPAVPIHFVAETGAGFKPQHPLFTFQDPTIQRAVEGLLGKRSSHFTRDDLDILAARYSLSIRVPSYAHDFSLDDLPHLFPSLRHFSLSHFPRGDNMLPEIDLAVLDLIPTLRAVEVLVNCLPCFDFARDLLYVSIHYVNVREGETAQRNNLAEASVLGHEAIEGQLIGQPWQFARIVYGGRIYEMFVTNHTRPRPFTDGIGTMYHEEYETIIFVSQQYDGGFALLHVLEIPWRMSNAATGFVLADVNFDGHRDILVQRGHFGAQGLVLFTCLLYENGTYVLNKSFSFIANPSLDAENQRILSTWRNHAASHGWGKFSFQQNEFVMTDRLTRATEMYDGPTWEILGMYYTHERFTGDATETTTYRATEISDGEIFDLIYNGNGFWGLQHRRWRTLFNQGTLPDWSIYGDGLNAQIVEVIG